MFGSSRRQFDFESKCESKPESKDVERENAISSQKAATLHARA